MPSTFRNSNLASSIRDQPSQLVLPVQIEGRLRRAVSFIRCATRRLRPRFSSNSLRQKRAGYIGWAGHGNLGDEAMLLAVRRLLPQLRFEPFGGAYRERMLEKLALSGSGYFDALFLGGGTLINRDYLDVVRLAARKGLPCYAIGTGVGSPGVTMPEEFLSPEWADLLARFRMVGVRGPISATALRAIGLHPEIIGDIALSAHPQTSEFSPSARLRGGVVINAISAVSPAEEYVFKKFRLELRELVRGLQGDGLEVQGLALAATDMKPTGECLGASEARNVHHAKTIQEAVTLLSGASVAVCMRLHGSVLSCVAGTAPVIAAYRAKSRDFAASMGLEGHVVDVTESGEGVVSLVRTLLADQGRLQQRLLARTSEWISVQSTFASRILSDLGMETRTVGR